MHKIVNIKTFFGDFSTYFEKKQNMMSISTVKGSEQPSFIPIDLGVGWCMAAQVRWAGHSEGMAKMGIRHDW